jgi:sec-independent protein translocase protein TatB
MFDIGWSELLVIGVVALIAIGPKELPGVLRAVGQWTGKIRRMAAEFQGQFQEAMREAEMADLKKQVDEASQKLSADFDPLGYSETWKPAEEPAATKPDTTVANETPAVPSTPPSEPAAPEPPAVAAGETIQPTTPADGSRGA